MELGSFKDAFKKYWSYYLAAILLALGIFLWNKADASYFENPHAIYEIEQFYCRVPAGQYNYVNKIDYQEKYINHKINGNKCYEEAKQACWWLPNLSHRRQAEYCITNVGMAAAPGTCKSKIITIIINTLVQYGIDCSKEWEYINTKFYEAQYHYEMAEFYEHLLNHL